MSTKLYVGNLSFDTTEMDLQDHFAQAGSVTETALMQDKFTGKSRGFAFVTFAAARDAAPPMWNVRIVSCVPGSPIDWAAMTPTASPMLIR